MASDIDRVGAVGLVLTPDRAVELVFCTVSPHSCDMGFRIITVSLFIPDH